MYGQFFILFGLILVGYYCNKKGYLPLETNKNVGHMVMRVTIPAMLITTIASIEITDRVLRAFLLSAAGQIAMMVVFGFLMRQYGRKRGLDSRLLPMLDLTAGSLNTGFIGLPVTMIFFGQAGIIYMSAGVLALNLYLWSYGVYLISDKKATGAVASREKLFAGRNQPELHFYFAGAFACGDAYGAICADSGAWLSDKGRGFIYTAFSDLYWRIGRRQRHRAAL